MRYFLIDTYLHDLSFTIYFQYGMYHANVLHVYYGLLKRQIASHINQSLQFTQEPTVIILQHHILLFNASTLILLFNSIYINH